MGKNNLISVKESDNIKVYHVIIEGKPQYEVGEIVSFPFSAARDFSKSKQYKKEAEKLLEEERQKIGLIIHHDMIVYLLHAVSKMLNVGLDISIIRELLSTYMNSLY